MSMCEWRSAWDEDYRCRVAADEGSKLCIFHKPGEKDIERFKQVFYSQIREEGPADERNPKYDFRGYVFPTGLTVRGEEAELILPREISGTLIMTESTIKGAADFRGAMIEGAANSWYATIEGDASFTGATIEGDANFTGATIRGNANFNRTRIEGRASFMNARIEGDADFGGASIGGYVIFGNATIQGHVHFMGVTIEGDVNFRNAVIGRNAAFTFNRFSGKFRLTNTSIGRLVRFRNPVFHKGISFAHCVASGLDLGEGKPRLRGWGQRRSGVTLTDVSTGYSFWRFARLTFEKEGRKHEADAAHYYERMWRWKALRSAPLEEEAPEVGNRRWERRVFTVLELLGIGLILRFVDIELAELNLSRVRQTSLRAMYTIMWLFDCVFLRWPTQYGASLSRIFATWGVLIGGFAAVYHLVGVRLFDTSFSTGLAWPLSFGRALYFSIITFTTLGYGDIKPMPGWGSALTATEAILGGIMMALTVLVIGRKFMR
ncbi:potassium channel family protein [Candidatus Bipolaricaulota bacterium]|nr:potassium channel family protein [Candidatus Bipolaricaulota bacterium]